MRLGKTSVGLVVLSGSLLLGASCAQRIRDTAEGVGGSGGEGGSSQASSSSSGAGAPACGNEIVEALETCDGNCAETCLEDADACTTALRSGNAATCDVLCGFSPVTNCKTGDGCCPAGCETAADADCEPCDLRVPADFATIQAAIDAAPVPSVICIGPGSYSEEITLRPHVSLRGSGPETKIIGHVSAHELRDANPKPTLLRDLRLEATAAAAITTCPPTESACIAHLGLMGGTLALEIERVTIAADLSQGTTYCAELKTYGGSMSLAFRDSVCISDRGLRFVNTIVETPPEIRLRVERSRFEATDLAAGMFSPVDLLVTYAQGDCADFQTPDGTVVEAWIQNNEFFRTKLAGVYLVRCLAMTNADAQNSGFHVLNNTFVPFLGATDNDAYALWNQGKPANLPRLRVANNLYFNTTFVAVGGEPPASDGGNRRFTTSPFVDLEQGDLRLAPGQPAIDTALPAHAPADDKTGAPRPIDGDGDGTSAPDVGAHEFSP